MLSSDQLAEFERTGIIKLKRVFTEEQAERMQDVFWGELRRRYEIHQDDPSTWDRHLPTGMKNSKKHRAFEPIFGPPLVDALDTLFGCGGWKKPRHYGQVLITMPNAAEWRVPHRLWHSDFGYGDPTLFAVKYWACIDEVAPGGGATPQVAGSHRVTARYVESLQGTDYKRVRDDIMKSHPWLKALSTDDDDPDRNARFMDDEADIDGIPVRVVELTGNPGDVYITHPWVMHSVAVNANDRPRLMRSLAIRRWSPDPPAN